jgi:hypothetical protein
MFGVTTHGRQVQTVIPVCDQTRDPMEDGLPGETFVLPNVYGLIKRHDESAVLIQRRWKPQTDPDNRDLL